ncbi:MAG: TonB-dependent receptor [Rhodospirillaceae bacterium]
MIRSSYKASLRCSAAFAALTLTAGFAQRAGAEEVQFDLLAQDAVRAIPAFAQQAGLQVVAPAGRLKGVRMPALNGSHDVRDALGILLQGTNLEVASDNGEVIVLRDRAQRRGLFTQIAAASTDVAPIQLAQAAPAAAPDAVDEIVVTGTRVVRDGYEAPTPVSVIGVEEIEDAAGGNLQEFVVTLPALVGNTTSQTARTSMTAGGVGLSTPQARNLGSERTLILLDGQRTVGSQPTGQVDINTFPQQLVARVDVVTGGASAAYGSDALAGVINFVLDREFTGIKGELQGGITARGDGPNWNAALSGGFPFAAGRGHLLISGEIANNYGIHGAPRAWAKQGWHIINNPAYGTGPGQTTSVPQRLVTDKASVISMTPGGIISGGPLKGIAFGPGGTPYNFQYGPIVLNPWMAGGGEWEANNVAWREGSADLDPEDYRHNFFTRASYDISDNVEIFAQFGYAFSKSYTAAAQHFASGDLTISVDNAFIPQQVRDRITQLQAAGTAITSFPMGSMYFDLPHPLVQDARRTVRRYVVGANGSFDAGGSEWNWDAYYQLGSTGHRKSFYDRWNSTYRLALDAVRNPATGAVVCRSTLTNPGNGCVPWNPFGLGVNSSAAADYVAGWSYAYEAYRQQVMAGSVTGEPFDLWAGPVSLAFGAEHRIEKVGGIHGPHNAINDSFVGNSPPTQGKYSVTEGFVEVVVPLAAGESWAQALDFNGAIRATSYSTSGYVTTWKAGLTYSPVDDIRFRFTQSRDIRAPHNVELFANAICVGNLVNDPFRNGVPTNVQGCTSGNPDLVPEKADTTGIGVVLQPTFLPGFQASADYFNIDIAGVIGSVGRQAIPDRCFAGETIWCSRLEFTTVNGERVLSRVNIVPENFIQRVNRGIDFEASYRTSLDSIFESLGGDITLRALVTRYIKQLQDDGTGVGVVNTVGTTVRDWKYTLSFIYDADPFRLNLTARGFTDGVYNVNQIECLTGCPVSTAANTTINTNYQPGATYFDLTLRYNFLQNDAGEADIFFNVRNLMDKDPAVTAQGPAGVAFATNSCNPSLYDCLGRVFRAGINFRM